jgi:carbon-monoxide dehydrogenase medium subunit
VSDEQITMTTPAAAGGTWSIDVGESLQAALDSPGCPSLLRRMLGGALSWQVRVETPVQRALTSPRIAPQWVAALLALGATVTVEGDVGPAVVALDALLQRGVEGELLTLHVETGGTGMRWGEARVARTPADEPIVAAVAAVEVDGGTVRRARVALTGAWSEVVRLAQAPERLVGGPLDGDRIRAVAEAIEGEVAPKPDFLGSEAYRRAMAGVLARRALEQCLRWSGEGEE